MKIKIVLTPAPRLVTKEYLERFKRKSFEDATKLSIPERLAAFKKSLENAGIRVRIHNEKKEEIIFIGETGLGEDMAEKIVSSSATANLFAVKEIRIV